MFQCAVVTLNSQLQNQKLKTCNDYGSLKKPNYDWWYKGMCQVLSLFWFFKLLQLKYYGDDLKKGRKQG